MSAMLQAALQYAGRGWPVFRVTASKTPLKNSHGHLDATTDSATITHWWTERPDSNIAMACGALVVIDADGPGGLAKLKAAAPGGALPRTLTAQTSRGYHFYFRPPAGVEIRSKNEKRASKGADGVDVKGLGGWVVLPPSKSKNGKQYSWILEIPPVEIPHWLHKFVQNLGAVRENVVPLSADLGVLPSFLQGNSRQNQRSISQSLKIGLKPEWSDHEQARIESALAAIPADGYDEWLEIGMALNWLGWDRPDGTSIGFDLWDRWSATAPEKYNAAALGDKWQSFGKRQEGVTVGTLLLRAREHGWTGQIQGVMQPARRYGLQPETPPRSDTPAAMPPGGAPFTFGAAEAINGHAALPMSVAETPHAKRIIFRDTDKLGNPKATCVNARTALDGLGLDCSYDLFHERLFLSGYALNLYAGELKDNAIQILRTVVHSRFGFDPPSETMHDAAVQQCLLNPFDPVVEYLEDLTWDGVPRLNYWMSTYLGADATVLNCAISRLSLIAAVRRARHPGSKFDQIIVLEGPEGKGKSSAIEILAGTDNYSDQSILTRDDKGQQEAIQGVWLYEIADLAGMSKADVEHVKAFASRKVDRARPAYGRTRIDRPRRCIFFATTNNETYLKSHTGNRRFWPVLTGKLDLEALARDRDQLWAEACALERKGVSTVLPESLWADMAVIQDTRRDHDPWDDILAGAKGTTQDWGHGLTEERIPTRDLFDKYLHLPPDRQSDTAAKRLGNTMRRLGWKGPRTFRMHGVPVRGYFRSV